MNKKQKKMSKEERLEMIKKEALHEMRILNRKIKIERQLKWFFSIFAIVLIIVVIKVFFGTIEIKNIFGYPPGETRFYKLSVNGKVITTNYNLKHTIPIVPFLVDFNSYYLGTSNVTGDEDGTYFYHDNSEKYIIDISSYNCYKDGYRVECKDEDRDMKENHDTKYTNLTITRTNNPYEEVYNGEFINDITPYVSDKGVYCVEVTAKYSLVETKVYFYFKR